MDLLTLDDPLTADVERFGGKVARLAAARRRGLPVLPGHVVPPEVLALGIAAGAAADAHRGPGRGRAAVWASGLDATLVELPRAASGLADRAIVRPSTSFDDEGGWSGAFSTVHDVGPEDLPTAVTACVASAFAPRTRERFDRSGRSPEELRMAVLIQPEVSAPVAGGWARVIDGVVEIRAVAGPPAPLLAGSVRGTAATVARDGALDGSLRHLLADETSLAIASLARSVGAEFGWGQIEWLVGDDGPVLLQASSGPGATVPPPTDAPPAPAGALYGLPAAPGRGTGPARRVASSDATGAIRRGDILVVNVPHPWLAPLLWNAAGLVSREGDPAAHLFEVARSLHVPAVAHVDLPATFGAGANPVIVVDGTAGWVVPGLEA
jgi:pyruvate,water dikinase